MHIIVPIHNNSISKAGGDEKRLAVGATEVNDHISRNNCRISFLRVFQTGLRPFIF